jgi:hypothetical protein
VEDRSLFSASILSREMTHLSHLPTTERAKAVLTRTRPALEKLRDEARKIRDHWRTRQQEIKTAQVRGRAPLTPAQAQLELDKVRHAAQEAMRAVDVERKEIEAALKAAQEGLAPATQVRLARFVKPRATASTAQEEDARERDQIVRLLCRLDLARLTPEQLGPAALEAAAAGDAARLGEISREIDLRVPTAEQYVTGDDGRRQAKHRAVLERDRALETLVPSELVAEMRATAASLEDVLYAATRASWEVIGDPMGQLVPDNTDAREFVDAHGIDAFKEKAFAQVDETRDPAAQARKDQQATALQEQVIRETLDGPAPAAQIPGPLTPTA